jgi:hypothetical protein
MFRCHRCKAIAGFLCLCLMAENVPAAREHIPVPDHSRVADEPPHDENHNTAIFLREPVRAAFTAGFSPVAFSYVESRAVTWRAPPVQLSMKKLGGTEVG